MNLIIQFQDQNYNIFHEYKKTNVDFAFENPNPNLFFEQSNRIWQKNSQAKRFCFVTIVLKKGRKLSTMYVFKNYNIKMFDIIISINE